MRFTFLVFVRLMSANKRWARARTLNVLSFRPHLEALEDRLLLSGWTAQDSGTADLLRGVWGSGPNDIFAVGRNGDPTVQSYGVMDHFDGTRWTAQQVGTYPLVAVGGSGPDDIYAVGGLLGSPGVVLHSSDDGQSWLPVTSFPQASLPSSSVLRGVWADPAGDVYITGGNGVVVYSHDHGSTWTIASNLAFQGSIYGVWGSEGDDVYVAGAPASVQHSTDGGTTWTSQTLATDNLLGVWGSGGNDVYAVGGSASSGLIFHSSDGGATWASEDSGVSSELIGVWGSGPNDVYAVGFNGTILHSTGDGSWTTEDSGTVNNLYGVWGSGPGDVVAVGGNGTILALQNPTSPSPYIVTTTADSGPGSLRDAINQINSDTSHALFASPTNPSVDEIDFNITAASDTGGGYNATTGVATIQPQSALPTITNSVIIDGYTQSGASRNTLTAGDNAAIKIELRGNSSIATGLELSGSSSNGSTIEGLSANSFGSFEIGSMIVLDGSNGDTIQGNYIGLDASGESSPTSLVNFSSYINPGQSGIQLQNAQNDLIGTNGDGVNDPAERNVISNCGVGVVLRASSNNAVAGNFIGTDASGTKEIGNWNGIATVGGSSSNRIGTNAMDADAAGEGNLISGNWAGISFGGGPVGIAAETGGTVEGNMIGPDVNGNKLNGASGNLSWQGNLTAGIGAFELSSGIQIGGSNPIQANIIAYNQGPGVTLPNFRGEYATHVTIQGNSIHDNLGPGIDEGGVYSTTTGLTLGQDNANSLSTPDGTGTGPNDLQHYPQLTSAQAGSSTTTISGSLSTNNSGPYILDFYDNGNSPDPSGYGQGKTYLGSASITNTGSFSVILPVVVSGGDYLTTTATDKDGDTSIFSNDIQANSLPVATAGGPYTVAEGGSLTLDASGTYDPDGDPLTYSWDVNGDGVYGDAPPGADPHSPVLSWTWAQLNALGINDGPSNFSVTVRVSDGTDTVTSAPTTLFVLNAPPTAQLSQPNTLPGSQVAFTLTATDPSTPDQQAGFTYALDWGDGTAQSPDVQTVLATANNGAGVMLTHTYAAAGLFTVLMTATDRDGGVSPVETSLVFVGSSGGDTITLSPGPNAGDIQVQDVATVSGKPVITTYGGPGQPPIHPTGPFIVMGGKGNDSFIVSATVPGGLVLDGQGGGGDNYTVNFGGWAGVVTIHDSYGGSKLTVNGVAGTTDNVIAKTHGQITWGSPVTETVFDSGVQSITVNANGSSKNYIKDPDSQDTTIVGGPGENIITLANTIGSGVAVYGGPSTNTYIVNLGGLDGPVAINNRNAGANDSLVINGADGDNAITFSASQVTAGAQTITLNAPLASVAINGGSGNNQITIANLSVPVQSLTLNGGGTGTTFILVNAGADVGSLAINGGPGDNRVQAQGSLPAGVQVQHLAPLVAPGPDVDLLTGDPFSRTGSFLDADPGEAYSATVDYGDGSGPQPLTLNPDHTFSLSHAYAVSGVFTVTVRVSDGQDGTGTGSFTATVIPPARLSGTVFEDFNDDGQVDFGEKSLGGVAVTLTGTDDLGQAVNLSQRTDGDGAYVFFNLRPGSYSITETQPAGYNQGIDSIGTAGGSLSATDQFFINLAPAVNGLNYNFGEQPTAGSVQTGQTAGIGFWNNKNGQALILAFNGGIGTQLANWLAATLPNVFGANAGSNNLTGKSNAYVAALFQQDFLLKGVKLDAQLLATALNVYATNATLDSTQVATQYGFVVQGDGVGAADVSVGSDGVAFGVANNSVLTVLDLLKATDAQTVWGLLYNGDATKRNEANAVYSTVNQAGGL